MAKSTRRRSLEARIVEYFESAPLEVARAVLSIARERVNNRNPQSKPKTKPKPEPPVELALPANPALTRPASSRAHSRAAQLGWERRRKSAPEAAPPPAPSEEETDTASPI